MFSSLAALALLCHVMCHVTRAGAQFDRDLKTNCLSRFDFDYKVMKQLMTLETGQEELQKAMKLQDDVIRELRSQREDDNQLLTNQLTSLQIQQRALAAKVPDQGSMYVRWGRTSCPGNGTELVYEGFAGGSMFDQRGAAANFLCLPRDPTWRHYEDVQQSGAEVHGAEYQLDGRNIPNFFQRSLRDSQIPCAICRSVRPSILMVPARDQCHSGWTREYTGYLTAGHASHSATEFICLDGQPEVVKDSSKNENGKLLYFAEGRCGSLKCPPYINGRELTCAVCTK